MNKYHLILLLSVTLTATSQLLMKKGAMTVLKNSLSIYLNLYTISGYMILLCVMIINVIIFQHLDMTTIIFFMPITYILLAFFSWGFFKEKITKNKVLATIMILIGILLHAYSA